MNQFLTNLKYQAEQNPLAAIAVGITAVSVVTKWTTSIIWAKEVARRSMKDALK